MSDMKAEPSTDAPRVLKLLHEILSLHEAEVDCETCNEQIDCLAELVAVGHDPNKLLPAVQEHLDCCRECKEEFQALLCILKAQQSGQV